MKAHELLSSPEKWTKGAYARNYTDSYVYPRSGNAECFCMLGAIDHCYVKSNYFIPAIQTLYNLPETQKVVKILQRDYPHLFKEVGDINYPIARFNDHSKTTHEMILAVLKEADV